jgi:hypothetical protein
MPLDQYAREGAPLGIQVAGLEETLWFVPEERHSDVLVRGGMSLESGVAQHVA